MTVQALDSPFESNIVDSHSEPLTAALEFAYSSDDTGSQPRRATTPDKSVDGHSGGGACRERLRGLSWRLVPHLLSAIQRAGAIRGVQQSVLPPRRRHQPTQMRCGHGTCNALNSEP